MAQYKVQDPSGQVRVLEGPDGATDEQIIAVAHQTFGAQPSAKQAVENDAISQGARNFNAGDSFGSNVLTGIGRGMTSIGRAVGLGGVAEKYGLPGTKADAAVTDRALLSTTGGKVGNVVGQAAAVAPAMLIPGANTLVGAGVIGAGVGAATTEGDIGERLQGAAYGAAGGPLGLLAGKGLGYVAGKAANAFSANQLARASANAGKDAAASNALNAGYTLPPTEVNPSMLNSALEGLSGKIKTSQKASATNQGVTNSLAQKELGLPTDRPITVADLTTIRQNAGQAYDAVASAGQFQPHAGYDAALDKIVAPYLQASKSFPGAKVNPIVSELESLRTPLMDSGSAVAKIKELRAKADTAYASGDKDLGKALKGGANAIEDAIDGHLQASGAPADVLKNFRDARQLIAKTYSVEKALNQTTGDVSAQALAAQLKRGKPLSGGLKTAAEAGQAFPKATQTLPQNYNAVSPLDYMGGLIGTASTGNPLMMMTTAARPAVRSAILSPLMQNRLAAPSYGPSMSLNTLEAISNNPELRRLLPGFAALPASQQ